MFRSLRGYFAYLFIFIIVNFALLYWLAGVGMANDISTEQRINYSAVPLFVLNYILGFPVFLFFDYEEVLNNDNGFVLIAGSIINSIIQFVIIYTIVKKRRKV